MIITLGCNKVLSEGNIDSKEGIFGILEEKIIPVITGRTIPAKDNTSCRHRRTPRCNSDCKHSVYGIKSGHKISYRNINKRM
jgi:hypothetical protein